VKNEKLMLLEENGKLRQTTENEKYINDPQDYFYLSGDKHEEDRFSPKLIRKQNNSESHYFNFFLGVIMMCAVFQGIDMQIQQKPDESITDIEIKSNDPPINSHFSTKHHEIRVFRVSGAFEGFSLASYQKSDGSASNDIGHVFFSINPSLGPLRPAESKLDYHYNIYYETGFETLIRGIQNEKYFCHQSYLSFHGLASNTPHLSDQLALMVIRDFKTNHTISYSWNSLSVEGDWRQRDRIHEEKNKRIPIQIFFLEINITVLLLRAR